jgi:NDP-sugar pyrophosphorylase family protein
MNWLRGISENRSLSTITKIMKAIILAAGKGERLKDITRDLPKPMINYKGKPLLQHNIELCRSYGVNDIYINLHHLPDKIKSYFGNGENFGVNIQYSFEPEPMGTAGAVKKIAADYWNNDSDLDDCFFVVYGDNFSDYDLSSIKKKLIDTNSIAVIAFHFRQETSHSGVAEFDENHRIIKFVEKPKPGESDSHWVNAGIYCLRKDILNFIPEGFSDFSRDIFPELLKRNQPVYSVCNATDVKAFDTPEMYKRSIQ